MEMGSRAWNSRKGQKSMLRETELAHVVWKRGHSASWRELRGSLRDVFCLRLSCLPIWSGFGKSWQKISMNSGL